MGIMQQSAYLVVHPSKVDSYGFPFNCTTVGQTSDLMTGLTLSFKFVGWCLMLDVDWAHRSSN